MGGIVAVYGSVGDGVYGEDVGGRGGGGSGDGMGGEQSRGVCRIREIWGEGKERKRVLGGIGIEYGIRLVVMIELEKIVKMERKEEGYRGMREKNIFCKSDKKFFA